MFTKPVRRAEIVVSKVIASIIDIFIFAVFSGVCNYLMIILPTGGLKQPKAAFTTTAGLFFTQLILFSTGLFIASIVKKQKSAIQIGTFFLLVFYGIQAKNFYKKDFKREIYLYPIIHRVLLKTFPSNYFAFCFFKTIPHTITAAKKIKIRYHRFSKQNP